MARLIPKIDPKEIALKPERDVACALIEQLPQDCIVYHSYPWLRADRNDRNSKITLREGEADFVVILPSLGFLILEVKGGAIQYDSENHTWYRQFFEGVFEQSVKVDVKHWWQQEEPHIYGAQVNRYHLLMYVHLLPQLIQ